MKEGQEKPRKRRKRTLNIFVASVTNHSRLRALPTITSEVSWVGLDSLLLREFVSKTQLDSYLINAPFYTTF